MTKEHVNLPSWAVTFIDKQGNSNITLVTCSNVSDAELYVYQYQNAKEVKAVVCAS